MEARLQQIVSTIISANQETSNPGKLFIATDDVTAAQLVILMKRRVVSYPIMGTSNLSTPVFMELIGKEPEERTRAGYFTDGILTTRSIIFDSANRYANVFLKDYKAAYENKTSGEILEPGDKVMNGYDAALTVLSAIQKSDNSETASNRERIYQALLGMDNSEDAVQGIIGPIFFEPSRN